MDIDSQISMLEGKSTLASFGSKAIFIKLGVSIVIGLVLCYLIKPIYILDISYESKSKEITTKLNYKNFAIGSFLISLGVFLGINQLPYFK